MKLQDATQDSPAASTAYMVHHPWHGWETEDKAE